MAKPVLHHCVRSRGLRALWTIEELGVDCDLRMMAFPPRYTVPDYKLLNPVGTVPIFIDGEVVLTESCAITHYLVTKFGPGDLVVEPGHSDYGAFLDFLYYADATLTFPQTVYVRFTRLEADRGLQAAGTAYADFFRGRLPKLEQRLAGRDYLCADRFTAADIAVGYALFLSQQIGLGHHLSPAMEDYLARLTSRPGFRRARDREDREAEAQLGASVQSF